MWQAQALFLEWCAIASFKHGTTFDLGANADQDGDAN